MDRTRTPSLGRNGRDDRRGDQGSFKPFWSAPLGRPVSRRHRTGAQPNESRTGIESHGGRGRYVPTQVDAAHDRGVVVAFDGRHGSREFARDAAWILRRQGYRVWLFDTVCATPVLAYALKALKASMAIMVTASHNPPQDNGYKLYWEDGAQIRPPHDTGVSDILDGITETPSFGEGDTPTGIESVPESVVDAYFAEIAALRVFRTPTPLHIVYTAMHGVGRLAVERALSEAGYHHVHSVAEQGDPDPDFPTVAFPNPEEPGAMDLALALAESVSADVVLANDPDADRLCVAVPHDGAYRVLSGNEVGILFANELLSCGTYAAPTLVTNSIVSTTQLQKVAQAYGAEFRQTLTGFKWLGHAAAQHEARGGTSVMGFEEALGYSFGSVVRDKDGVSAALLLCDLVSRCRQEGITVVERLGQIEARHGVYLTSQKSLVFKGASGQAIMAEMMDQLRADPPTSLMGQAVVAGSDYLTGQSWCAGSDAVTTLDMPASNVLSFYLADETRLMVRPSGTEPKIKFYFEICEPVTGGDYRGARESAAKRLASFSQWVMDRYTPA